MEKWNAQETEVELLEDNGFHDFLTERRHFFWFPSQGELWNVVDNCGPVF